MTEFLRYPEAIWSLPLLFTDNDAIITLLDTILADMHIKPDNKIILFGSFRNRWNGGRQSNIRRPLKTEIIEKYLKNLVKRNFIPSFTFSNYHIQKEDLENNYCNQVLDIAIRLGCQFIVSSDLLLDYIKNKNADAFCTCSVIKPSFELKSYKGTETQYYNEMLSRYDKVVLKPEYVKNYLKTEADKIKDISRVEALVNQTCFPNCPYSPIHYTLFEEAERQKEETEICHKTYKKCPNKKYSEYDKAINTLYLTEEELDFIVNKLKIRYLKLQGRDFYPIFKLFEMLTYLFKTIGPSEIFINKVISQFIYNN